jgi:hypothetical protein
MQKWFSGLALAISVVALAFSIWTYQQADARADAALKRREKALVEKQRPRVERICREFGFKEPPKDAETVDELIEPLGGLFEGLSR